MQKTVPAPPKRALDVFGGWMSIQEFREVTERNDGDGVFTLRVLPPKMVPMREILEKQESRLNRRVDTKKTADGINLDNTTSSIPSTNFRLRRVAPERGEQTNILERIMGITTANATNSAS